MTEEQGYKIIALLVCITLTLIFTNLLIVLK
jgi:hypothetical protein